MVLVDCSLGGRTIDRSSASASEHPRAARTCCNDSPHCCCCSRRCQQPKCQPNPNPHTDTPTHPSLALPAGLLTLRAGRAAVGAATALLTDAMLRGPEGARKPWAPLARQTRAARPLTKRRAISVWWWWWGVCSGIWGGKGVVWGQAEDGVCPTPFAGFRIGPHLGYRRRLITVRRRFGRSIDSAPNPMHGAGQKEPAVSAGASRVQGQGPDLISLAAWRSSREESYPPRRMTCCAQRTRTCPPSSSNDTFRFPAFWVGSKVERIDASGLAKDP